MTRSSHKYLHIAGSPCIAVQQDGSSTSERKEKQAQWKIETAPDQKRTFSKRSYSIASDQYTRLSEIATSLADRPSPSPE
ncbi:hypothetical protein CC2G_001931 [Coprinopsis cinerea AmutBmut pab1-1]|nr:hypothetical protein CC2G_001931 [Coprinopsis cinerea AmutBmut pab1-1]